MSFMTCRICGAIEVKASLLGRDIWRRNEECHSYTECGTCGCIQIDQYPDDMSKYYGEDYYSFNVINYKVGKLRQLFIYLRDSYAISGRGIFGRLLFWCYPTKQFSSVSLPGVAKDKAILDVGCGDGSLIRDLARHGYRHLLGIDPFGKDDRTNRGYELRRCDIFDIEETFDVIIMKGTLEHQPNQIELMKKAHSLLRPGGRCIIRIPICDSYAYRRYGTNWVQFDCPRHLYLHTKLSIRILAEKSDFEVANMWDDSELLQIVGSEQLLRDVYLSDPESVIPSGGSGLFDATQIREFLALYAKIQKNQMGDTFIFDFKKNEEVGP